jgi:hypothetical protein
MFYKLLGMMAWKGARWFMRRKYYAARHPKPLLTGGLFLLVLVGAALAVAKRPALHR